MEYNNNNFNNNNNNNNITYGRRQRAGHAPDVGGAADGGDAGHGAHDPGPALRGPAGDCYM